MSEEDTNWWNDSLISLANVLASFDGKPESCTMNYVPVRILSICSHRGVKRMANENG